MRSFPWSDKDVPPPFVSFDPYALWLLRNARACGVGIKISVDVGADGKLEITSVQGTAFSRHTFHVNESGALEED